MKQKTAKFQKNQFELIKSPVIAEFLGFKNEDTYLEGDLESAILSHIRDFLMELGRGFAFVAPNMRPVKIVNACVHNLLIRKTLIKFNIIMQISYGIIFAKLLCQIFCQCRN